MVGMEYADEKEKREGQEKTVIGSEEQGGRSKRKQEQACRRSKDTFGCRVGKVEGRGDTGHEAKSNADEQVLIAEANKQVSKGSHSLILTLSCAVTAQGVAGYVAGGF